MDQSEALALAGRAYRDELAQIEARHEATRARDRLRKLSPRGGPEALPDTSRADWEWHRQNQVGFDRMTFAQQRKEVLGITGPRGVDGYGALAAAGMVLLQWLEDQPGPPVTASKFGSPGRGRGGPAGPDGNVYAPSYAVDFLAEQFLALDPALADPNPARPGADRATDAAFRVVRAYLAARSG